MHPIHPTTLGTVMWSCDWGPVRSMWLCGRCSPCCSQHQVYLSCVLAWKKIQSQKPSFCWINTEPQCLKAEIVRQAIEESGLLLLRKMRLHHLSYRTAGILKVEAVIWHIRAHQMTLSPALKPSFHYIGINETGELFYLPKHPIKAMAFPFDYDSYLIFLRLFLLQHNYFK